MGASRQPRQRGWVAAALFAGIGGVLLVLAVVVGLSQLLPDASRARTSATIIDLSGQMTVIEYQANGQTYEVRLGEMSSGDYVGKQIEVSYRIDAPWRVRTVRGGVMTTTILGGIGSVFLSIGTIFIRMTRPFSRGQAHLMRVGVPVEARIVGVDQDSSLTINDVHPWRIACEGSAPGASEVRRFVSGRWLEDPTPALRRLGLTALTVYVDPSVRSSAYVVDDRAVRGA